jgi:integrase
MHPPNISYCAEPNSPLPRSGLVQWRLYLQRDSRHSAATRMLRGGATFKEIADVLGHASIGTTAVYAKLDIPALSRVAMQWPENAP